jgi:proteic killer suppression protein
MIKTFKSKALKELYLEGNEAKIDPNHVKKLKMILARLDAIHTFPKDMDLPGFNLHALKGKLHDFYSVKVDKNWRVTFRYEKQDIFDIDYQDYH